MDELPQVCLKFALAVVLSGVLGLERERKGRAAGLRTHELVCLGATLLMVVSDILAREWAEGGAPVWLDRGRIAAGIVTGVGFLGAGTIMRVGAEQRGLTTAAMIWFVAALGIAIGAGFYVVSIIATGFALVVVLLFERIERVIPSRKLFSLAIRVPKGLEELHVIERAIRDEGYQVAASRIKISGDGSKVDLTFDLYATSDDRIEQLAKVLAQRFTTAERIVFER